MSDLPSPTDELRMLEEKRRAAGLTPAEEVRRTTLASGGAPPGAGGFDVSAAAAVVRAETPPPPPRASATAARDAGTPPAPADPTLLWDLGAARDEGTEAEPIEVDAADVEPIEDEPPDVELRGADPELGEPVELAALALTCAPDATPPVDDPLTAELVTDDAPIGLEPVDATEAVLASLGVPPRAAAAPPTDQLAAAPVPDAAAEVEPVHAPDAAAAELEPPCLSAPEAAPDPLEPRAVPPPAAAPSPSRRPPAAPGFDARVAVHTADGQVRRGLLREFAPDAPELWVAGHDGGAAQPVRADDTHAIFFMLAPGEPMPPRAGRDVEVTFRDGRRLAGVTQDYDPGCTGFFVVPTEGRSRTARVWVYRRAVRRVDVSEAGA